MPQQNLYVVAAETRADPQSTPRKPVDSFDGLDTLYDYVDRLRYTGNNTLGIKIQQT